MLEILQTPQISTIKCVVLDYDGTLTTFRRGWERILYDFAKNKGYGTAYHLTAQKESGYSSFHRKSFKGVIV